MRRLLATVVLAVVLALGALAGTSSAALAQGDEQVTTSTIPEGGDIIPEPNSGSEPEDPGDRGGALQSVLFVAIVGAIIAIGAMVVRQSRRARAERGY